MGWKKPLGYIAGSVNQELLLRTGYLVTDHQILRSHIQGGIHWRDGERKVKEEALSRLILFGECSLRHALTQYEAHNHHECPHQGMGNVVLMPLPRHRRARQGPIQCRERLGGLLKYYDRDAASRWRHRSSQEKG